MSSITGIINVDNTITGIEDLYLDDLNANTIDVNTVDATTILLNGSDLETTLNNLQSQINNGGDNGGGYFVLTCEYNGNAVNGSSSAGFFSFGGNITTTALPIYLPNCSLFGIIIKCQTNVTANNQITTTKTALSNGALTGIPSIILSGTNSIQNISIGTSSILDFLQGDTISLRFSTSSGGSGGTAYRAILLFRTNAVNGTNGINGTNGTNGQNVSFNASAITTITPATTASINDTITTSSGTQNHALTFNIPRGKNSNFQVGTISSTGLNPPSLSISGSTDANGDNLYTMNFGLQQGPQGPAGPTGPQGDTGDQAESTIVAIAASATAVAAAGAAAASAGAAAASAAAASTAGAIAGAEAGSSAAQAVTSSLNARVTTLEGEMDIQQTKTQYISQSSTETTIGGSRTICNSTYGFLSNTIEGDSLNISTTINTNDLNVTGESYFADDILIGDTKKLLTNEIVQRQYPANGDILINATNLNIGVNGNTTDININSTNVYSTNTIFDVEATDITLSSNLDFSEITIGSILDLNTSCEINTRNINIGTNAIGMTSPVLNVGTFNRTTTQVRGETIEILASEDTSINGSNNLELDATNVIIGHVGCDVSIQGSNIDIGTSGVLNYINIGNDYSVININSGVNEYVNIDNFINQLGF